MTDDDTHSRRSVLGGAGAILGSTLLPGNGAGCGSRPYSAVADNSFLSFGSSGNSEGEIQRLVSLESQDSVPDEYDVEIDVDVVRPLITDAETARLRITTTNTGSRKRLPVGEDRCVLFGRSKGGSDDPQGLWLHRTENIDREENRWVADRSADERRWFLQYACLPRTYEAGESVSNEYFVWDDYQVPGYLKPGRYRWETGIGIAPDDTDREGPLTWGFSLRIEEPARSYCP